MGKKRKAGESSEREELEQLRSEEDKPDKKKAKEEERPTVGVFTGERTTEGSRESKREKKRKKQDKSNNDGRTCDYLPGRIHETPNERDPLRVFLESLYQQLPDNELARQWMIEWGLLPREEAIKVLENEVNEKDVPHDGMGTAKEKLKKKKVRL
ncbi:uncharacterized protein LOC144567378 [Carex rostrata]